MKTQSTHEEVLKRVVQARQLKKEGKTLTQVAEAMGLSRHTVNYYVYGNIKGTRGNSSKKKAHRIVSVLGATTTNGAGKAGLKEWLEQYLASPNLQEIVRLIEKGEI